MGKKFIKHVPNILSFIRIILIVPVIILYMQNTTPTFIWSIVLLVISCLTDFFDGKIARRFDAVSKLGKALDGAADKLMQLGLFLCLIFVYGTPVLIVFCVLVVKELIMGIEGLVYLVKTKRVTAAKMHGKVASFVIDVCMVALFLLRDILLTVPWVVWAICGLCIVMAVYASVAYNIMYYRMFKELREHPESVLGNETEDKTAEDYKEEEKEPEDVPV